MYEEHWGLTESPFPNGIDSRWFYEGPTHEEALARLFYLIEHGRRFGLLLGATGTGKSLLLDVLATQARRSHRQVAFVDLLGLDGHELLWQLAAALNLAPSESTSRWALWRLLEDHLAALKVARLPTVCVFDHLERSSEECVSIFQRLLHLPPGEPSPVTYVVAARSTRRAEQYHLLEELSDLRVELEPFDRNQTAQYIRTLLGKAGVGDIFSSEAIDSIHNETAGVPRSINRLCELSLLAGMAEGCDRVDASVVHAAAAEFGTAGRTSNLLAAIQG